MKKFIIIGNSNAIGYKDIFPFFKNDEIWLGHSITGGNVKFNVPDDYPLNASICGFDDGVPFINVKCVRWFTNIDNIKRHIPLVLTKTYNAADYPPYDNYNAIEVGKTKDIPKDYDGIMGVPITFLDKYCPEQFEIIGTYNDYKKCDYEHGIIGGTITECINKNGKVKMWAGPVINGVLKYARLLIRRRNIV